MKAVLINAQSIRHKVIPILELASDNDLDIIFITETWLNFDDTPIISSLNTDTYKFNHPTNGNKHRSGSLGILH